MPDPPADNDRPDPDRPDADPSAGDSPADDEPLDLEDEDFVPAEEPPVSDLQRTFDSNAEAAAVAAVDSDFDLEPDSDSDPDSESSPNPGPGVGESIAWMIGAFGLQIAAGVVGAIAVLVLFFVQTLEPGAEPQARDLDPQRVQTIVMKEYTSVLFAVVQTIMVAGVLIAAMLRLGRERSRLLSLRPIPWRHTAVVFGATVPIAVLSTQLYAVGLAVWRWVVELAPGLEVLDEMDSMSSIEALANQTPLWLLVLLVAVAPAIWEELVFRGVIGRGLIARLGLPAGMVLTAVLFAMMHLNPPHVFALLPLSLYLHIVYLCTRSFWAPMLVHFLNNALAVVMLKSLPEVPGAGADPAAFSLMMAGASALSVGAFVAVIWQSRVQFVDDDGAVWNPGRPTAESPPDESRWQPRCRRVHAGYWIFAGVGLAVFLAAFIATAGEQ